MIPSKIEFLRKSYSPFVKEMLDKIGESLAALPDLNCEINDWSHTVTMPRMLSDLELANGFSVSSHDRFSM